MARSRLSDPLQLNKFHLLDVSFSSGGGLPIFIPLFGFRSVTLPTWTTSYKEVKEGNFEFKRYGAVEKAEFSPITLEQGVTLFNSDFYDWMKAATLGKRPARNLLLIQFTNISATQMNLGIPGLGFGFPDGLRYPGRAWLLKSCKPISYKPGSDFDATSGEVSLAMIEFVLEEMVEFSLGL